MRTHAESARGSRPRTVTRNLHGGGWREHEVYDLDGAGWDAITNVPCPVEGCAQTLVWAEAGTVPGYRVCMQRVEGGGYDAGSLRHRFVHAPLGRHDARLVRDDCCECDGPGMYDP